MIGSLPAEQWPGVLRWLLWLALAGVLARPLVLRLLPEEAAAGWIWGKILGWLLMGWLPWLLASLGLVPFRTGAMAGLVLLAALAWQLGGWKGRDWRGFALCEAGFLLLFWLGLAIRLSQADLLGLEKFTDMGFLAASQRSDSMPPEDAWFAGAGLNYYYLGQATAALWALLAGVPPDHGYQLAMATLFALTGQGIFALTFRLARPWGGRLAGLLGGLAAGLSLWGGNFHSVLYTLFRPLMGSQRPEFYFPDSTRFIGYDPDVPDKGFTEFIAYAFRVGDLHAHVAATPLFLLGVALILALLRRGMAGGSPGVLRPLALGWVLGLAIATNAWDLAILGVMALVAALLLLARAKGRLLAELDRLGAAALLCLGAAGLTALPFLASFEAFSDGIAPVASRSPLWQLLVVYGHVIPALALLALLAARGGLAVTPGAAIFLLAVSGLLLVALPETLFMRDIYGADHARANTMFKLSFRAQTLLLVAALAALAPLLARTGRGWTLASLAASAPLVALLAYAPHVFSPPSAIRSLDGMAFLGPERALVEAAHGLSLRPGEALLEAPGESFTGTSRVSAMTGLPAVIGWHGHEWLWRGALQAVNERSADARELYSGDDPARLCRLIRRYGIRYVVLGEVEHSRFPGRNFAALRGLGAPVHESPGGEILRIRDGACERGG